MGTEKLYQYEGLLGWLHGLRDGFREKYVIWKENHSDGVTGLFKNVCTAKDTTNIDNSVTYEDFSHIYRRKSRKELIRVSSAVMGIEFSYAAETAFVSPTLLKIGVEHKHMTLVWALSPFIGFFLTPILGSLSDRCNLKLGRRRPFIIIMSVGVLLGLILVPNGETLGYIFGDMAPSDVTTPSPEILAHRTSMYSKSSIMERGDNASIGLAEPSIPNNSHPWGILFTILGTVLLDFDADACQSPARAYLLDVTVPEDHARGLSTFTIMAGLGGFLGYGLGGINWDVTFIGELLGGHVRAVFTLISVIFIVCVSYTITSFREIPLEFLKLRGDFDVSETIRLENQESNYIKIDEEQEQQNYGTLQDTGQATDNSYDNINGENVEMNMTNNQELGGNDMEEAQNPSFSLYLQSIIFMPYSIKIICLTNLFCWMAHVSYSLYFTDFVGEAVFNGNPTAPEGSSERELYETGVRFGCWGMSMYSLSCACYSAIIEKLINRLGAKNVYTGGLLVYSAGMFLMAITKHPVGVIIFSWTAGVMYSTLFTMPYLLVAHYHATGTFAVSSDGIEQVDSQVRGLGTDIAIVSSMVFLAQFILSICMGALVSLSGTTTAIVTAASGLAFCGAISATQVMYLDL